MGFSGQCNPIWLSKMNFCEDSRKKSTCTPVYQSTPNNLLGKVIANTIIHEIGHVLGLLDEKSYTGADIEGHNGDPTNCMFIIPLHKEYRKLGQKNERTKKYTLKAGETLSSVARIKGLRSKVYLERLRGKDGRSNEEIIKSGGKEIWVVDIIKELKFYRDAESIDKNFTNEQILFMRKRIIEGKTMIQMKREKGK